MLLIINNLNNFPLFLFLLFLLPIFTLCGDQKRKYRGRFTDNLQDYQLLVPHKINYDGEFMTFNLPHYYEHDFNMRRRKRDYSSDPAVHYKLYFNGKDHHLELFPNYEFLAPEAITERHSPDSEVSVSARQMKKINPLQCHYTGKVRGVRSSSAAVSCCNGLSGYVQLDDEVYFIEPADGYGPNVDGHHLHVIHTHSIDPRDKRNCGSKNWSSGWRDAFHYRQNMETPANHANKDPNPTVYYLEILVVADKKFLDYHRDKDYENYILTIMNMASNLFHDSSTGELIELNIVRIIYMDQYAASIDLEITHEASKSLASFCRWQESVNPKEIEHPQHHDIAVLLTRQDICEGDESEACQLLGLAYFTQACNPSKSCAINEDSGLVLGVVVAHELGHILGADHDTIEDSGCSAEAHDTTYHIMGPIVRMHSYSWSKCTRKYFRELFENGLGDCLMDEPAESKYKFTDMLPGSVYDADYQCRFMSANSSVCPTGIDKICKKLFCRAENNKCRSYGEPPADGTKCGHDQWCYQRECVPIGDRPSSVAGGWSDWGNWSDCSRTCGGGVQFSERECNNPAPKHGGLYCLGEHKQYKICHTKSCGIGVKPFRAVQCSEYDTIPFAAKFYTWLPVTPAKSVSENTCVLYCKRVNGTFSKLAPRAQDGTPCLAGTHDMCLSGNCHKVGCDWQLDSTAIEDNCGVCNGDGKDCKEITGVFSERGSDYLKAIKIPKGARKIEIVELKPSVNFIAVQNEDKEFLLNGNPGKEASDGEKNLNENLALYEHTEPKKEFLYLPGPTDQDLTFLIYFYENENVGYRYSYHVFVEPTSNHISEMQAEEAQSGKSEYHWENVDWSECSARCDGGEAKSESKCISNSGGGEVNDLYCLNLVPKPEPMARVCNKEDCKIFWHTGDWAPCSGCKHHPGAQFRSVWCAKTSPRWEEVDILTAEQDCIDVDGPKPLNEQLCIDECKKVNCRRGRSTYSTKKMELDEKDIYNYKFFEKLFRKINKEMREPSEEVIELTSKCNSHHPTIVVEPTITSTTTTEITTEIITTPATHIESYTFQTPPLVVDASNNNDTETPINSVQNPDSTNPNIESVKCPIRSNNDRFSRHRVGRKHVMFLFPRRHNFRRKRKMLHKYETETQTPPLIMIKDKIPEGRIKIEEAKMKFPNIDFLSDYAYQKLGDRVTGSLDLDHEKVWRGEKAIVKIEKERIETGV